MRRLHIAARNLVMAFLLFSGCGRSAQNSHNDAIPEEGYVKVHPDISLFYQKTGSGKQVIFIPAGWWLHEDFKQLASEKRTLLFYDVRNRARSSYVRDTMQISFMEDVEDIERMRRHFGYERINLVGWSYLGCVVMLYALKYPAHVENIIQIGPIPYNYRNSFDDSLSYNSSQVDSAKVKEIQQLFEEGFPEKEPRRFAELNWKYKNRINLVADTVYLKRLGKQWGGHLQYQNEWYTNMSRQLKFHFRSFQEMNYTADSIKKIKARVLTIAGTKDRNVPFGSGKQWASLVPASEFLRVKDAAHIPWIENPELVFKAIDMFLEGSWPASAVKVE